MIPVDDIAQVYIESNDYKRGMVSDILDPSFSVGAYAIMDKKHNVSLLTFCDSREGHDLVLALTSTMKDNFGRTWVENVVSTIQKTFL